jgi:hypothetical protein
MVQNDPLFKQQIAKAPIDTIYTINKLFKDIDSEFKLIPVKVVKLT